jgi:hypothetical protein
MTSLRHQNRHTEMSGDDMLWYNNPDAITATHLATMAKRTATAERRRLMRLVDGGDATSRR